MMPFQYEIDEAMTPLQFIANVGGLMGLFMGFSFVSAVEVVYHFLSYLGWKFLACGDGISTKDARALARKGSSYSRVHVMSRPTSTFKLDRPPSIVVKSMVPEFEKRQARKSF